MAQNLQIRLARSRSKQTVWASPSSSRSTKASSCGRVARAQSQGGRGTGGRGRTFRIFFTPTGQRLKLFAPPKKKHFLTASLPFLWETLFLTVVYFFGGVRNPWTCGNFENTGNWMYQKSSVTLTLSFDSIQFVDECFSFGSKMSTSVVQNSTIRWNNEDIPPWKCIYKHRRIEDVSIQHDAAKGFDICKQKVLHEKYDLIISFPLRRRLSRYSWDIAQMLWYKSLNARKRHR